MVHVPGHQNCGAGGLSRLAEVNSTVENSISTTITTINTNSADEFFLSACVTGYKTIKFFRLILYWLSAQTTQRTEHIWTCENGLLWYHDIIGNAPRLGIPTVELQVTLVRKAHDSKASNHQGMAATLQLLQFSYIGPRMAKHATKFVHKCQVCQRARKGSNLTPGLFQPLEIPTTA